MAKLENKNNTTIEAVVRHGLCTGCGTCVGLCPRDAIDMVIDHHKGIYVPRLDKEKCNQCGLCLDVCPGHSVDFKQLNLEIFGKQPDDVLLGNYLNCYIGHATDYDIRYNSASGGLVTALLISALEQGIIDGALVTRMRKDRPLEPEPFIARTREEIISAAKSKYCPVPANVALKEILRAKKGEKFAIVGLPCHIHGIRKAELVDKKLKEKIALHLGLVCTYADGFWVTKLVLDKYGIRPEDIAYLDYRGGGWPGYMTINFKDKTRKLIPFDEYTIFHNLGFFAQPRCFLCCDGINDFADISLGDAWLPEVRKQDNIGTSLIISRYKIGEALLEQATAKEKIALENIESRRIRGKGTKKAEFRIKSVLSYLTGKKIPQYNIELPKPRLIAYPRSLQLFINLLLSRGCLWALIEPLARLQQATMKIAKAMGFRL